MFGELDYDQGGISKAVNWQGGGSFVYCELAELNAAVISRISKVRKDDHAALSEIWTEIQATGFINYKIDLNAVDESFDTLEFSDKKKFLIDILDKNLLYINYCDLDDEEFPLSKEDKQFNRMFYGK